MVRELRAACWLYGQQTPRVRLQLVGVITRRALLRATLLNVAAGSRPPRRDRCTGSDHRQMNGSPPHNPPADDTIQDRLDRMSRQPPVDPQILRRQLAELDELAEDMIGRRENADTTLEAAIQHEVLRRGPDRTIPVGDEAPTR